MSKSPESPDINSGLMHLLESSLEVQCLNAGSYPALVQPHYSQLPYTLIGQNTQAPLVVRSPHGELVRIEPGGGYILPERQKLYFSATDDRYQLYHWAHIRFRILGNIDLFDIVQSPYGVDPEKGELIGLMNQQLAQILHRPNGDILQQIARRKLVFAQMLVKVLEWCPATPGAMQKLMLLSRFQDVFQFITDNLRRPILCDELFQLAGLSPSRFHASFHQATGLSPMAYVTQLRLRQAQEMLLRSEAAVHTIANDVGFRDPFHFSRTFSKHMGVSPSQYRRQARIGILQKTTPNATNT